MGWPGMNVIRTAISEVLIIEPYWVVRGSAQKREAFPRILSRYVREENVLPIELASRKMNGATARALKLKGRQLLKENFRADDVIFDPKM